MKGMKIKKEKGITLVALVLTVILLLILATIVIRNIVGHEGLVDTTLTAKEEYQIEEYRGAIEQIAQKVIMANNVKGKDTTREDIAKALREEEWVKTAEPDEETKTILIITKEGYIFELFYDELYGKLEVEYIGKDPSEKDPYPKVKGRYDQRRACIYAEATVSKGYIAKLELIYRNEVRGTIDNPNGEQEFDVEKIGTGWYKIRATTDKGKKRTAWVYVDNVDSKIPVPIIKKDKEPNSAGWYNIETVPVTISIIGEGDIRYRAVAGMATMEEEEGIKYTEAFPLQETGTYTIYAWKVEGGYRSSYAVEKIRIDTNKPELDEPEITGVNGKEGIEIDGTIWHSSEVEIKVSGRDETSEPIHYEYQLPGKNETWVSKEMTEKINLTDEGETKVAIKTVDTAGNSSDEKEKKIGIDRIAPKFSSNQVQIEPNNIGITRATFIVNATDEGSGKNGKITYTAEIIEKEGTDKKTATSNNGTIEITNLKRKTSYIVTVKAKDPVGNESTSITGEFKTVGRMQAPNVEIVPTIEGTEGNDGWIKGAVTITIEDSLNPSDSGAEYIYYEITKKGASTPTKQGGPIAVPSTTINFSENGEYEITAWVQDGNLSSSNKSTNTVKPIKIDDGTPGQARIEVSETNRGPGTNTAAKDYYYHTVATVTVYPGTDVTSGAYGVRIEVTGANASLGNKPYEATSSGKAIDITIEGDTTINAWTIDNAGNESQEKTSITMHLDNTAPNKPTLSTTTTRSSYSTASDPWYNNSSVSLSATRGTDKGTYQSGAYQIAYGTRTKGTTTTPSLTTIASSETTISVSSEGKWEVVAYTIDKCGNKSEMVTNVVQIDRTKPTVSSLSCSPSTVTSISMTANGANDSGGSGIAEYMFFIDGSCKRTTSYSTSYTTTTGTHVASVSVVDRARKPKLASV